MFGSFKNVKKSELKNGTELEFNYFETTEKFAK